MSIDSRLTHLLGRELERPLVVHVAAVCGAAATPQVIRIDDDAPRSETDRLVLGLARARAEWLVTSGQILREEPTLQHALGGDPEQDSALWSWRRRVAGLPQPPRLAVLSRRPLPSAHPALLGRSDDSWARLEAPSLREALDWLRRERGARRIAVECGPQTARPLYDAPCAVDELWLSHFEGAVAEASRGPDFVPRALLEAQMELVQPAQLRDEESGLWRFERWRRRETPPG